MKRRVSALKEKVDGDPDPLTPEFEAHLDQYRPVGVSDLEWAAVRPAFLAVMRRCAYIKGRHSFVKRTVDVCALVLWAHRDRRDLSWRSLMDFEVIYAYIRTSDSTMTESNLAQRQRRLKNLASRINPSDSAPPRLAPTAHSNVKPPYTEAEMAAIRRTTLGQPNQEMGRRLAGIVGLSRGAGAASTELIEVRGSHCDDRGADGIYVTLGKPGSQRTVPVRRDYEDLVRIALEGIGPNTYLLPGKSRHNAVGSVIQQTKILSTDVPAIEASRLRTTWLAQLMTLPIPLPMLLAAAGLKGARTISELYVMAKAVVPLDDTILRGEQA